VKGKKSPTEFVTEDSTGDCCVNPTDIAGPETLPGLRIVPKGGFFTTDHVGLLSRTSLYEREFEYRAKPSLLQVEPD
jgi:hypothetical protein